MSSTLVMRLKNKRIGNIPQIISLIEITIIAANKSLYCANARLVLLLGIMST